LDQQDRLTDLGRELPVEPPFPECPHLGGEEDTASTFGLCQTLDTDCGNQGLPVVRAADGAQDWAWSSSIGWG